MDWDTCPDFEQGSGQQISEQQLKRCEEPGRTPNNLQDPTKSQENWVLGYFAYFGFWLVFLMIGRDPQT
jgi:hypothetical protein